ncbi:MAG: SPOR domain-containing protein [Burkholderiaceae bacterium]|nr:SPOR domain-containing protein [Burkholderiaceae bacterium]
MYGVLGGVLLGLAVAAGVAYYVIKAPMPFVDKASRTPDSRVAVDPRNAPDPNAGLAGHDSTGQPLPAVGDSPLIPIPSAPPTAAKGKSEPTPDDLGALIATLRRPSSSGAPAAPAPPPARPSQSAAPTDSNASSGASSGTSGGSVSGSSSGAAGQSGTYFLQVGSFRVLEDAEALRARVIMMGMPVEIQRAEVNGLQVNRVRVGPFARIDDMNRTRARLGEEKIPATVVRQ